MGDVQGSVVSIDNKAKLLVVSPRVVTKVQRVREILVVLPHVGQKHLEAASFVSLDRTVLHYPMEKIIRVSCIATELIYPFAVVCDQAIVNVNRYLRHVCLVNVPIR